MWFVFTIATTLIWGLAELFYKKGANSDEKYSHLKICVCVGTVMGIHAIFTLLTQGINYNPLNLLYYAPVSLLYILSMTLSFYGIRYIEESLSDPIENTSGAICMLLCVVFLNQKITTPTIIAVLLILAGIIGLGYIENRSDTDRKKKYGKKMAIIGFAMPFCYAILDALGSFLDIYYLDINTSPLIEVTDATIEQVANTSYELSFAIFAIFLLLYMKSKHESFGLTNQRDKIIAAVCETAGQFTYVYAMSGNGAIAAPIISSVCVVSLLLSRIFLHEKLSKTQYFFLILVVAGILAIAGLDV